MDTAGAADSVVFFLNCFVTLLSILDPFGAAATFLALTPADTNEQRLVKVRRAVKVTALVLLVFMVTGRALFELFGVSLHALMAAGGLILAVLALKMVEGKPLTEPETEEPLEASSMAIVPMAIPMLAGPGAITAVIVFAERAYTWTDYALLTAAILLATFLTRVILVNSQALARRLGITGLRIAVRLMGLILLAMGIEFIFSAIDGYFFLPEAEGMDV